MTTRELIDDFLAQHTLAIIGLSRSEKDFSRLLLKAFHRAGHTVYGVNPHGAEVDGERCRERAQDLPSTVGGALLMVPAAAVPQAIRDCAEAHIARVWVYGTGSPMELDEATRTLCRERGLAVINGICPLMFLRSAAWPHRLHGWFAQRSRAFRAVPA